MNARIERESVGGIWGIACATLLVVGLAGCAQAAPEPPPPATTPAGSADPSRMFFDDFVDGDLRQWEPTVGEWLLVDAASSKQYAGKPSAYGLTVAGGPMWTDYQVEARVTIHDDRGGPVGVAGRVQGGHYYYELILGRDDHGNKTWSIRRQRNHTWVTLATGPYEYQLEQPYTLRLVVNGNRLEGWLADGDSARQPLGTAVGNSEDDWSLGRIGLVTYGGFASFANVAVYNVTKSFTPASAAVPWGNIALLRDTTTRFPGAPAGGWYVTPIHVNLRPRDGKVLVTGFGRKATSDCTGATQRQVGETWTLDPSILDGNPPPAEIDVLSMDEQNRDTVHDVLYCAGHAALSDGRVFLNAGTTYPSTLPNTSPELGINYSRIFDPTTGTIARISASMKGGQAATPGMKWYPTDLRLPDGKILMFGGFHWSSGGSGSNINLSLETFDPKIWDADPTADPYSVLTQHSEGQADLSPVRSYTEMFLLPKPIPAGLAGGLARSVALAGGFGHVFLFDHEPGPSGPARLFARPNSISPNPSTKDKQGASGVLLSDGRLMFADGGHDGQGAQRLYFYDPTGDSWSTVDTGISRINCDAITLADGTVLITNGYTSEPGSVNDVVNPVGDVRQVQIVDPYAAPPTVTTLPAWPEPTGRGYHSVALLLKDGRVLIGGGKDDHHATGCEKNELRIFTPPY
ncbi:MAG: hypothetical protein M3O46_19495, partial [Myxococcota bacterium]|nr:hypothetical protein [Myxococcota bacterium]